MKFVDMKVSRSDRYSLGREQDTGKPYLSIPVANRLVDYEEYYQLTDAKLDEFMNDASEASSFADECRSHLHDELLILKPGRDRGTAI